MASLPVDHGNGSGQEGSSTPRFGHVYIDMSKRVLRYLNPRAKQLHQEGVPFVPQDLEMYPATRTTGEAVTGDDLPLVRSWKDYSPHEATFVLPKLSGQQVTWNTAPLRNEKDQVVGIIGSVSLGQGEPDWQALAGLAHDLRTPLQALKLLVALLDTGALVDNDVRAIVDRVRRASDRALSIGMDLLEWCRGPMQGGRHAEAAWFELSPFLFDIINEQTPSAQAKSLRLVTDLASIHAWEINADRVRLGRLLSNLLVNAIRYTSSGSVQFRAEWQGEGDNRKLSLGVVDTGVGIAREEQDSIFQPFERGKAGKDSDSGGSGIGLSVVERLVQELGLELEVYSEFGRGSEFHLLVPGELLRPIPDGPPLTGARN